MSHTIPLRARQSLTPLLLCIHFQTSIHIFGSVWSFQIHLPGKECTSEELVARVYALHKSKAPDDDRFQANLSPPLAITGVGIPRISALISGGSSKGTRDQSQPPKPATSLTFKSNESCGIYNWLRVCELNPTCFVGCKWLSFFLSLMCERLGKVFFLFFS